MSANTVLNAVSWNDVRFFCGSCYLRSYNIAFKLFTTYLILKKLIFQYFLCIACYEETKFIIDCVSVIPIDDLADILSQLVLRIISVSSRDTKLYGMV